MTLSPEGRRHGPVTQERKVDDGEPGTHEADRRAGGGRPRCPGIVRAMMLQVPGAALAEFAIGCADESGYLAHDTRLGLPETEL